MQPRPPTGRPLQEKLTRDFDLDRSHTTLLPKIFVMNALHTLHGLMDAEAKAVPNRLLARLNTRLA